jgi:hypothetical protein
VTCEGARQGADGLGFQRIYIATLLLGLDGLRWAVWAPSLASIFRGGPYSVPASVNTLIEADILRCPPRLIDFARLLFVTVSVNKK